MRNESNKRVKRELPVPAKRKQEILRDSNEFFDSAAEHGESEEPVIERPDDPAACRRECAPKRAGIGKKGKIACGLLLFGALLCFLLSALIHAAQTPDGIIGWADASTDIVVAGNAPLNYFLLFLILGSVLALFPVLMLIRIISKRKRRK